MDYDRIVLINPAARKWEHHKVRQKPVPSGLPLGLGFLASYLETKGVEAIIYDEQVETQPETELLQMIADKKVRLVGITAMTLVIHRALDLAEKIKKISGDIKIIVGGVHPSVMPEECLRNKNVDMVVRREGEITLWESIEALRGQKEFKDVAGLSFKSDGTICHNPDRPVIEDLDTLPPFPFHIFEKNKDMYQFSLVSSRGCPFRCIFCSARSISGYRYRYRSAPHVIQEIEFLVKRFGLKDVTFHDDNFTFDKGRVTELCDQIIRNNLHKDVKYYCLTRADMVNQDILTKMKEAGFHGIYFGIETASDRLMKLIQKGETVADNVTAIKLAKKLGFRVRGAFMMGFPTETREETMQTIKLARNLPLDFVSFSLATPFPGTRLCEIALEEGYRNYDFSDFNVLAGLSGKLPPYAPRGRTPQEFVKLQKWAYFFFYLKPARFLKFIGMGLPELCLRNFSLADRFRVGLRIALKLLRRN